MRKKTVLKSCIVLSALIAGFSKSASAGHVEGNGSILRTYEDNPWFTGRASVRYCISIDETHYSVPRDQAIFEVQAALDDWVRTINALPLAPAIGSFSDGAAVKDLTRVFRYAGDCQSADADLRFFLGFMTADVKVTLREDLNRTTLGYAKRVSYDINAAWSKGYIWLSPDFGPYSFLGLKRSFWRYELSSYRVLLHELGHVFGFQHGSGIMDADSSAKLVQRVSARPTWKLDLREALPGTLIPSSQYFLDSTASQTGRPLCNVISKVAMKPVLLILKEHFHNAAALVDQNNLFCLSIHRGAEDNTIEFGVTDSAGNLLEQVSFKVAFEPARRSELNCLSGTYAIAWRTNWLFAPPHCFVEFPSVFATGVVRSPGHKVPFKVTSGPESSRIEFVFNNEFVPLELWSRSEFGYQPN